MACVLVIIGANTTGNQSDIERPIMLDTQAGKLRGKGTGVLLATAFFSLQHHEHPPSGPRVVSLFPLVAGEHD